MECLLKNRNKRWDHLATRKTTYTFYFALKIGNINKTHTHTESGAENSKFQFWLTITKPFSPFYLEETTSYWSLGAWWEERLFKNRIKRCDRLASRETRYVLLFSAKNRIYIIKTRTYTRSGDKKTLYFSFDWLLQKSFSPFYLEEMKNYWSLVVSRAVSQLIMRVNKPAFAYKLVQRCSKNFKGEPWSITLNKDQLKHATYRYTGNETRHVS